MMKDKNKIRLMCSWDYLKPINFDKVPNGFVRFRNSHLFVHEDCHVWNGIMNRQENGLDWRYGYILFNFSINKERVSVCLHRMLAECFIPNPNNYPLVRHLNDIKTDNRLINLAWGDDLLNVRDAFKNGLMQHHNQPKGENHNKAKLKEADVLTIRSRYKNGNRVADIVKDYPVSKSTVERIVSGKSWAHIN